MKNLIFTLLLLCTAIFTPNIATAQPAQEAYTVTTFKARTVLVSNGQQWRAFLVYVPEQVTIHRAVLMQPTAVTRYIILPIAVPVHPKPPPQRQQDQEAPPPLLAASNE